MNKYRLIIKNLLNLCKSLIVSRSIFGFKSIGFYIYIMINCLLKIGFDQLNKLFFLLIRGIAAI